MGHLLVIVADSVFPNLDPTRLLVSKIGADLSLAAEPTPEAIVQVAHRADAVLVTYAKITAEMIRQMTRCRIIARFGIGVDNVDIAAATEAGIVVTRVPDYCVDEVSDHTMALLLAVVRKIPFANSLVHTGRWGMPAVVPIHRLRGTVLGLVGFGRIPQLVAPKAKAFGIKVVAYDPYVSESITSAAGVERVDFATLLKISDYVSIHTPLAPETHHLFDAKVLAQMKSSAFLINTARGPIVDEAALPHALDTARIAGAALDVLSSEPPQASRFFGRDDVILTPHISFYSEESLIELQTRAAEEVVRVLTGQVPRDPVNPEVLKSGQMRSADA